MKAIMHRGHMCWVLKNIILRRSSSTATNVQRSHTARKCQEDAWKLSLLVSWTWTLPDPRLGCPSLSVKTERKKKKIVSSRGQTRKTVLCIQCPGPDALRMSKSSWNLCSLLGSLTPSFSVSSQGASKGVCVQTCDRSCTTPSNNSVTKQHRRPVRKSKHLGLGWSPKTVAGRGATRRSPALVGWKTETPDSRPSSIPCSASFPACKQGNFHYSINFPLLP